jgi:hypothetical protein
MTGPLATDSSPALDSGFGFGGGAERFIVFARLLREFGGARRQKKTDKVRSVFPGDRRRLKLAGRRFGRRQPWPPGGAEATFGRLGGVEEAGWEPEG